ncbi:metallophosphoesterase [Subsaxibacter sp. CAU 1640]|uniref:metallophosphoesterase n=1 Tax=Subsaxibacter sp. CAU 1640 TaxID=2933271 RepID=UPI002002FD82|nr:metallophosphoesterase [Subsaxibacter sp. CAU 1640]MCK7590684.1 metallophosphoesterase [Subsaxibacter sp. CAU 1640]
MKLFSYIFVTILWFGFSVKAQNSIEFVVLPDTQTYVEEFPEVFLKQMQWISEHSERFSFVLHEGDITQNNSEKEWQIAKNGFKLLEGKIPYSLALGNHDMGSAPGKFADTRNTYWANHFFPYMDYASQSNAIATFPEETIDNTCSEFDINGQKWLVFSLEFGPRNKTVAWANDIIMKHQSHKIIINTHAYLFHDNTLLDGNDWALPQNYGVGKLTGDDRVNDGAGLWESLVKKHKNIIMVFTGHITGSGVGQLINKGDHGNLVYQMLANYQKQIKGVEKGDSGYLRIIKVDTKNKSISVKTYSPWLDRFRTEPSHQFEFKDVEF